MAKVELRSDEGDEGCCPKKRVFTDLGCFFIFAAYCAGLGYLLMFAFKNGNIKKVTQGFDWRGKICGVDHDVKDKPYLYWCVKPNAAAALSSVDDITAAQHGSVPGGIPTVPKLVLMDGICVATCPSSTSTMHKCPDVPTFTTVEVPSDDDDGTMMSFTMTRELKNQSDVATVGLMGAYCFPTDNEELIEGILNKTGHAGTVAKVFQATQGVMQNYVFLIFAGVLAFVVGYLYLALVWAVIKPLVLVSLLIINLGLLACSLVCLLRGLPSYVPAMKEILKANTYWQDFSHDSDIIFTYFNPLAELITGGIFFLLWFIFSIVWCCSRKKIQTVVDAMKETCTTVMQMPTLLLQPVFQVAMLLVVLSFMFYGLGWVLSLAEITTSDPMSAMASGEAQTGTVTGLKREFVFTQEQKYMIAYWVFGIFWMKELVNALGQFTISHAVVKHHMQKKHAGCLPLMRGYINGFARHLGSLAFGAFLLGCLGMISFILKILANQTRAAAGEKGKAVSAVAACCSCIVDRIADLMRMVNQMVYVDICLEGTCYVVSSYHVVKVMVHDSAAIGVLIVAAVVVKYIGLVTIGGVGTLAAYKVLSNPDRVMDVIEATSSGVNGTGYMDPQILEAIRNTSEMAVQSSNIVGSTVAAAIICFSIAFLFMTIIESTATAMTYCRLWDIKHEHDHPPTAQPSSSKSKRTSGDKDYYLLE